MVRKLPLICCCGSEPGADVPPERAPDNCSRKPPCCCSDACRYCGPQLLSLSCSSTPRRAAARCVLPPCNCSSWFCICSRLPRACLIWPPSGPHCGGGELNSEKKPV